MKRAMLCIIGILLASQAAARDLPAPIRALTAKGITIVGPLPAPPGFRGYIGKFSGQLTPVYLMPDGRHVTIGVIYDRHGRDLTHAAFRAALAPGPDPAVWPRLGRTHWIAEGAAHPRRIVYVFTDTECTYCHALWLAMQPYLRQGDVQVRHILVAVIAPLSRTRGAAVLAADDPAAAMRRHEQAFGHSPVKPLASVPEPIEAQFNVNLRLMNGLDAFATPTIVYRDASGRLHMSLGTPDPMTLRAILGSP